MTNRFRRPIAAWALVIVAWALAPASNAASSAQPPPPPPPGSGAATAGPARPTALEAKPAPGSPVAVPVGDGAPVVTDGAFSPGEWDDALRVPVGNSVDLYLKQWRGVVFIGLRGESGSGLGPSELGLAAPGGPVLKLHVSAQLFESVLPGSGDEPPARMGFTNGWYANEQRRDEAAKGAPYPSDGIEFAIRRSKLAGDRWLLRVWASARDGERWGMLTWPAGTAERTTAGWAELRLE